jgi:hypothetical protein
MLSKRGVETEATGAGGNLTAMPSELSCVSAAGRGRGVGQPKDRPPFYSKSAPIIAPVTSEFYRSASSTTSHNGKILKGQRASFTRIRVSVGRQWEFRSPFFTLRRVGRKFGPSWGQDGSHWWGATVGEMAFVSLVHARPGWRFRLTCNYGHTEESSECRLTETLMLLESCEFCRAGAAHLSSANLRCRRGGWLCFGAEGFEGARSAARQKRLRPGLEAARAWCPKRHDTAGVRPQAVRCDTWTLRTCKEGTARGRDKGRRV